MDNLVIGSSNFSKLTSKKVNKLLDLALSLGINQIDTSPYYGLAETMIGYYQRRNLCLKVSTKVGMPRFRSDDWQVSELDVQFQSSMHKLGVSKLDNLFIHSLPVGLISKPVLKALNDLKSKNFVRNLGYSGDNENLEISLAIKDFDSYMVTMNALDVSDYLKIKSVANKEIYIKRPLANAVFNRTLLMTLKSHIKKIFKLDHDLYPSSYPSRYKSLFGEPKFRNTNLMMFIQFLIHFQPNAKYVFGISSSKHLIEIVKTFEILKNEFVPELDEYMLRLITQTNKNGWRALS